MGFAENVTAACNETGYFSQESNRNLMKLVRTMDKFYSIYASVIKGIIPTHLFKLRHHVTQGQRGPKNDSRQSFKRKMTENVCWLVPELVLHVHTETSSGEMNVLSTWNQQVGA